MKTLSNYPAKILIGTNCNEKIYLSAPSWDCGWYWGFGYLGNRNSHYHVDGLNAKENINLFDAFKKHFGSSLVVRDSQLWTLCELFKTFYVLKETAEVLGRGGSHFTTNPCSELITNKDEVTRINTVVLPAIFEEIYKILIPAQENEKINNQLVKLNNQGDTLKVVEFMNEYKITTDDLKNIVGITAHDFSCIHSMYWKIKHSKKATA
jgi:hypothetical protein